MLTLQYKVHSILMVGPELVLNGKTPEIVAKIEDSTLEIKARKEVFLLEADAESFFHYLEPSARQAAVHAATLGYSEIFVIDHLEGDAAERTPVLVQELTALFGPGIHCSQDRWECLRDLEFFFPFLDSLPVERTLALIKPDGAARGSVDGKTLEQVVEQEVAGAGLFIISKKNIVLDADTAGVLCEDLKGKADFSGSVGVLTQEPGAIAFVVEGRGAIGKLRLISGPAHSGLARDRAPTSLRAKWGTDSTSNAIHVSASFEAAEKEIPVLFPEGSLKFQRTLCIVKPHAQGSILQIKADIAAAGFTILEETTANLTPSTAEDFFEAQKDHPSFSFIIKEATSAPSTILALGRVEAVTVFKQLVGPESVKDARQTNPWSLRARFGKDSQRDAVYGSDTVKGSSRDVRFFFPHLGAHPIPDESEMRDYIFRKTVKSSLELQDLAEGDVTLQHLLSEGLMALCKVQPKGLAAVKWLSDWLVANNPNNSKITEASLFAPPERKLFVEYGVNRDGLAYAVEAPREQAVQKPVVEVDLANEPDEKHRYTGTPPFVVFAVAGPGSHKDVVLSKLVKDFNLVLLSVPALAADEKALGSYHGTELSKYEKLEKPVPTSVLLAVLKKHMLKHQDANRFLIDGFPLTKEEATTFEQDLAEVAFVLHLEVTPEEGAEGLVAEVQAFQEVSLPVVSYYNNIGKVRTVQAYGKTPDEVFVEAKRSFLARFLYLLGPPGAPVTQVADKLQAQYGYSSIDFYALLQSMDPSSPEAAEVKKALAKGIPVPASIACPLVLAEIYREMAVGVQNFVICNFPQSKKQAEFLEFRVPSITKPVLLDLSRADADDLAANLPGNPVELELAAAYFYGEQTQELLKGFTNLERIPISLAVVETNLSQAPDSTFEQELLKITWESVSQKVRPSVIMVLGLPGSGVDTLAKVVAKFKPNTQVVDCNQLLDKELERKTEIGLTMHAMLARGQVVPLSVTMELLKGVINLTCSDSVIIDNCPLYTDQISVIEQEFRIEKAFYLSGSEKACQAWKDAYIKATKPEEGKTFDDRKDRLNAIADYLRSREPDAPVLEVREVDQTVQAEDLLEWVEGILVVPEPEPVVEETPADDAAGDGDGDE